MSGRPRRGLRAGGLAAVVLIGAAAQGAECHVPARPFCLAGSGGFPSAAAASLCASATLDYARLLDLLGKCDPDLAAEAAHRATLAFAKLRCKARGLRPC